MTLPYGYGPPCPRGHGEMWDLPSGRFYCSHADHQAIYGPDDVPEPWRGAAVGSGAPGTTRAPRTGVRAPRRGSASVRLKRRPVQAEPASAPTRRRR